MIEKKRPNPIDAPDLEDEDDALHMHQADPLGDEDPLYPDYEETDEHSDSDIDHEGDAAKRKRKGAIIYYGSIAVLVVVIGYIAYPQVARTFGIAPKVQQTAAGVPVPMKARESKFTLADTAPPATPSSASPGAPAAPAGAFVATSPDVQPAPTPTPTTEVAPTLNPAPSVAMAPAPAPVVAPPPNNPMPATTTVSVPAMPAAQTPSVLPAPLPNDQAQAHIADLDNKVSALQASVAELTTARDQTSASLKQIEISLDSLQKQIAAMGTAKPSQEVAPAVKTIVRKPRIAGSTSASVAGWSLRSAMTGMALLGEPGTGELKRVSVGDTVPGLGKILSISEQNGRWVVKGSSGSVGQ